MIPAMVLIIGDPYDHTTLIGLMLEDQGYNLRFVTKPADGITEAMCQHPDLIIIPPYLGPPTPSTLCQQLRSLEALRKIPILMVSRLEEEAYAAGADAWVTIFMSASDLQKKVADLLTNRKGAH